MTRAVITLDADRIRWCEAATLPGGGVRQTAELLRDGKVVCLLHLETLPNREPVRVDSEVVDQPLRGPGD